MSGSDPPGGPRHRRRARPLAGAAAGLTYAAPPGVRRRPPARRRPTAADDGDRAVPRRAPGRHHHGRAGPPALRRARRRHRRPGRAARPADPLDPRRRADDGSAPRRRPGGVVGGGPWKVPRGHRRGARPRARAPHGDDRLRPVALRRPLRPGRPQARGAARAAGLRSATTSTRRARAATSCIQACSDDPQVAVHAVRNLVRMGFGVVVGALEPARLRPHVVDLARAGDAAQHVRLQGRHRQHQVRGHRRPRPSTCGSRPTDVPGAARVDGRRLLPRRPPDPDAHRGLGPHPAPGAGADRSGATRGSGRRSARPAEFDEPDFAAHGTDGEPADPGRRARAARPPRATSAASASCAAATTSPTAPTAQGHLDAGLFFLAFMRDAHAAVRADAAGAREERRPQRVHRAHRVGPLRLPAGARRPTTTGAPSSSPEAATVRTSGRAGGRSLPDVSGAVRSRGPHVPGCDRRAGAGRPPSTGCAHDRAHDHRALRRDR